jgi:hypothetical protein
VLESTNNLQSVAAFNGAAWRNHGKWEVVDGSGQH